MAKPNRTNPQSQSPSAPPTCSKDYLVICGRDFTRSIGPAMHPKVPDDSSQPYHRSIQLPSATASGNREKQPPFNNPAAICSLPEPPGMTKFQVRPAQAGVSAIRLA